jgi:activator of HSP90 ATPase
LDAKKTENLYVLQHVHQIENSYYEDAKLIGIFSSRKKALDALVKHAFLPEFRDYIDEFSIDEYILNKGI